MSGLFYLPRCLRPVATATTAAGAVDQIGQFIAL